MDISLNRHEGSYTIQTGDHQVSKTLSDGVNKLLLQNIKIGDLFSVEIIDSMQKEIKLMLEDGSVFEATLNNALNLHIGEKVTFVVKDIVGKQVIMEAVTANEDKGQDTDIDVDNILKELNLEVTETSQRAVKSLMQKMLPINKDSIRQLEIGLKSSNLSMDSLLSMLENEIPITPSSLSQVEAYENGEIKLQGQLEQIIDNILESDNPEFLEKVHTILKEALDSQQQGHLENKADLDNRTNQTSKSDLPSLEKDQQIESGLEDKSQLIEQIFDKDGNLSKASLSSLNGKNLTEIKEEISNIFKELLFVDPKNIKNKSDLKLKNIKELYKEIYKLADGLEKIDDRGPREERLSLYSNVKSNLEFLNISSKYDTIIHIPLLINNQYKHGELYIFNKEKKHKQSYKEASMLISLETVYLGTVESYIRKYNNQISVQFKTESKEIEDIVKGKIDLLKGGLKNKGYDLSSVSYVSMEENFTLEEEVKQEVKPGRYRFDTKA